jgi:hypothetical protein
MSDGLDDLIYLLEAGFRLEDDAVSLLLHGRHPLVNTIESLLVKYELESRGIKYFEEAGEGMICIVLLAPDPELLACMDELFSVSGGLDQAKTFLERVYWRFRFRVRRWKLLPT